MAKKVNKSRIFIAISLFIAIVLIGILSIKKINTDKTEGSTIEKKVEANNEVIEKNYKYEKLTGSKVSKEYTGMILTSVITIIDKNDHPCLIEVSNIKDDYNITSGGKLDIINTKTGDNIELIEENEIYKVELSLDKDVEYEIQLNNRVIGAVIAVDDLNAIDGEELYSDISVKLSCGLQ